MGRECKAEVPVGGRRRFKDAKASGRLGEGNSRTGLRGRPVGVARRYFKALPAARRQHGRPPGGIRGGLLAWPGGTSKLCRRRSANMDGRRAAGAPQAAEMSQTSGTSQAAGRRHHQSKVRPCPKGAPLPFGARKRPAGRSRRACTCTLAHLHSCYLYSLSHLSK